MSAGYSAGGLAGGTQPYGPPSGGAAASARSGESAPTRPQSADARYGLLGLLDVIRMTDPDLNTLALGTDLTSLGLRLSSAEPLYSTFSSPWSDAAVPREHYFTLPSSFHISPVVRPAQISRLQAETLIYAFYAMPRDLLQVRAAQELYKRDWTYSRTHKLWFAPATAVPAERRGAVPADGLVYFDVTRWAVAPFQGSRRTVEADMVPAPEIHALADGMPTPAEAAASAAAAAAAGRVPGVAPGGVVVGDATSGSGAASSSSGGGGSAATPASVAGLVGGSAKSSRGPR